MKVKRKRSPLLAGTTLLIALMVFSSMMPVFAAISIMNKTPPYSSAKTGHNSNGHTYANINTGYVRAKSWDNGWAYAHMIQQFTNIWGTIDRIRLDILVSEQYKYVDVPWPSSAYTYFECEIRDKTAGTKIFDEQQQFIETKSEYYFNSYTDLQKNHVYEVSVGVYVWTNCCWWACAEAELGCEVDKIVITGYY